MAQLVARLVWDQEVEGSSPFTPTKEKWPSSDGLFSLLDDRTGFFDLASEAGVGRRFGRARTAQEFIPSTPQWRSADESERSFHPDH